MLAGNSKERVTYDQLTMGQWMAGFCRTVRIESDKNYKEAMLNYLISLLDYVNDFSWSAAKACYTVLVCRMGSLMSNRVKLKILLKLRPLTELEGHMPRNMFHKVAKIKVKFLPR